MTSYTEPDKDMYRNTKSETAIADARADGDAQQHRNNCMKYKLDIRLLSANYAFVRTE